MGRDDLRAQKEDNLEICEHFATFARVLRRSFSALQTRLLFVVRATNRFRRSIQFSCIHDMRKEFIVHMCNKLASRHVRVGLADPCDVSRCDICENAPAFFYCEVDGTSLCLQCDMIVHVGGKRTHGRYLLFRQRVEFPGDKPGRETNQPSKSTMRGKLQNHKASSLPLPNGNSDVCDMMDNKMIDLNARPQRGHGQASNNLVQEMDVLNGTNHEYASVVPVGALKGDMEK